MINPIHLKYFCDACENQSISQSAKINKVSHSAISQAIKALESALNVELIVHQKRMFQPTELGLKLYRNSSKVFDSLSDLELIVTNQKQSIEGPLKLGFSHTIGLNFINPLLVEFIKTYNNVIPEIYIGNSNSLEDLLVGQKIDVGLGIEDGSLSKFERTKLWQGRFVLAALKNNSKKDTYLIGDKGFEIVAFNHHFKRLKSESVDTKTVQSWSIATDLAERGVGIALVPDFVLKFRPKLKTVHEEVRLPKYDLCAFYRNQKFLDLTVSKFIEYLKEF